MRWKGRRESNNVDDRRGAGGAGGGGGRFRIPIGGSGRGGGPLRAGGGSIGFLIAAMVVLWLLGINPLTLLDNGAISTGDGRRFQETTERSPAEDELASFVRVVLAETEDTWSTLFAEAGDDYPEPRLVLFTGGVSSACGYASAATGPFYCPGDQQVYIDLAFYDELKRRFAAPGDFAQAYVIAHEVGHHVQNVIGILPEFNRLRASMGEREANAMSVRVELQADCFAGIWARDAAEKGLLEAGDLEEAMNAASQIGDDAIQKRSQGYVVPESFNHGTSEQRMRWLRAGYETGSIEACDTFEAAQL